MKMKAIMAFVASAAMSITTVSAQETEASAEENSSESAETSSVIANQITEASAEQVTDGGIEAVYIAEESASAEPLPEEPKDAFAEVKAWAKEKGFKLGRWDSKKKRMVVAVEESFDCEDPAKMPDVMIQRDMATKRAVLQAKAEIIQFVKEEVSAEDIVEMVGADAPDVSEAAKQEDPHGENA